MSETTDEMKTIRVLAFSGEYEDWDEWSEKYLGMAAERGYRTIMESQEEVPREDLEIEETDEDGEYIRGESERTKLGRLRKMNLKGFRDLQLATTKLAFQLVSLSKTEENPSGCLRSAWQALREEYDVSEGEDRIQLLEDFQQNKLMDARTNVTEWLTSIAQQVSKLAELNHKLDDDYLITHILASLPKEYSSLVDQAKIDRRRESLDLKELKKRLKERCMHLKRENGWSNDEMSLAVTMKNTSRPQGEPTRSSGGGGKKFKGKCKHCGKQGHKKAECWELHPELKDANKRERKGRQDLSKVKCYNCNKMGHYASSCPEKKKSSQDNSTNSHSEGFAMTTFEQEENLKDASSKECAETQEDSKGNDEQERKQEKEEDSNAQQPMKIDMNDFIRQTCEIEFNEDEKIRSKIPDLSNAQTRNVAQIRNIKTKNREELTISLDSSFKFCIETKEASEPDKEIKGNTKSKTMESEEEEDDRKPPAKRYKLIQEEYYESPSSDEEEKARQEREEGHYAIEKSKKVFAETLRINAKTGEKEIDPYLAWCLADEATDIVSDLRVMMEEQQRIVDEYLKLQKRDRGRYYRNIYVEGPNKKTLGDLRQDEKKRQRTICADKKMVGEKTEEPFGKYNKSLKEIRTGEIWKERRLHMYNLILEMPEESEERKKEEEIFWRSIDEDECTVMYQGDMLEYTDNRVREIGRAHV